MKKVIAIISILVTLTATVAYTTIAVSAHPGRTDSSGGHANYSTGEYHFHHGYSAHDHYDMDGDGTADCPFEFDDKTDHKDTSTEGVEKNAEQTALITGSKINVRDVIVSIIESVFCAIVLSGGFTYFLSSFLYVIWGEERGRSACVTIFALLAVIAFSVFLFIFLK